MKDIQINKRYVIPLIVYVLLGIYLAFADIASFVMYITVLPIQIAIFLYELKKSRYIGIVVSGLLLLTQGVDSVLFYYFKSKYAEVGYNAVRSFHFLTGEYFQYFSYVFIFELVFFLVFHFVAGKEDNVFLFVKKVLQNSQRILDKGKIDEERVIIATCILASTLSIWMYSMQIGIRGLPQTPLPFHLTGILYYFREFCITGIILIAYFKCKNKNKMCFFIMLYSYVLALASASRGLVVLLIAPILCESIFSKKPLRFIGLLLWLSLVHDLATSTRNFVYYSDIPSFLSLIGLTFDAYIRSWNGPIDMVISLIAALSSRLYGCQCVVLAGQQAGATISDLIGYYCGKGFGAIFPNSAFTVFGIVFPSGKEFGVGLGAIGQIIMLANHSYLSIAIQAAFVALIFGIQQRFCRFITIQAKHDVFRWIVLALISFALLVYWMGLSWLYIYLITIVLVVLGIVLMKFKVVLMNEDK